MQVFVALTLSGKIKYNKGRKAKNFLEFMLKKAIDFIKYNNLTVLILLGIFLAGSSVFAQTETGQAVIGEKQVTYQGVDNTLLLQANLENLDMDFKIESISQDDKYYYVTYTFINLEPINNAWQYQLRENKRKISRKLRTDLGKYLAKQLKQEYDARIKELKIAKQAAEQVGESQLVEVEEYSGLIGKTLAVAGAIFPGYEPIKKTVLPSPSAALLLTNNRENVDPVIDSSGVYDDLSDIYSEYINDNDPDLDNLFGDVDNCPLVANPDQLDSNDDGIGDACESNNDSSTNSELPTEAGTDEPNVEVIELPIDDNAESSGNETSLDNSSPIPEQSDGEVPSPIDTSSNDSLTSDPSSSESPSESSPVIESSN